MAPYEEFEEEEFSTQFNGQALWRILQLIKPYRLWVIGFLVLIAATSLVDAVFTYINKQIIDQGIMAHDLDRLIYWMKIYGVLVVMQSIQVFGFISLAGILGERVQLDLRKRLFQHLQALSFSYFDKTPVGWIMARVTSDSGRIAELVTWGLVDTTWAVINITTTLIFMATVNYKLALIIVVLVPIMVGLAVWFKQRILVEYRKSRKLNSQIIGTYNETITGVRVVKALTREPQNLEEFAGKAGDLYQAAYRAAWLSALFLPAVQLIGALGMGAVIWYGGIQFQIGDLTLGGLQAFLSYLGFMMWPIQDLARVYANLQQSIASAERTFSLMDARPEVIDREGAIDPGTLRGAIAFDHVDFQYGAEGQSVLKDFNLSIRPGERIALVGPTGGGKSTIVNLLCRFYEPTAGTIRIADRDYTTLTQRAIQSRIGMVLQTPHLFSGTVRENIRYGRLDATDEEVENAAKIARAHNFIIGLEKGYDTDVGEGGGLLSVGQKQLISLARAMLANPDIFIMDEATSSVDTLTEAQIQEGMDAIMEGRTSFIIAHRLSTIKNADRILVIENGRIREMGAHHELLQNRDAYYNLYTRQFRRSLELAYGQE